MTLRGFVIIWTILALISVSAALMLRPEAAAVFCIVFGWISFLYRVLHQLSVDWSGVATALGCLLVLGGSLHWLVGWVATWPGATKFAWRWTKAPTLLAGVALLFWAGLAAVGLMRSTQWLLQLDEPYFEDRRGSRTRSVNNLKQLALANYNHNDQFNTLPPGTKFDRRGQALHGWQTLLLPHVEQEELYAQIRLDLPWNETVNRPHFRQPVRVYEDPHYNGRYEGEFPVTHFAGNVYVLGARALRIPADFRDGTSNTLLMGEAAGNFPPWGQPLNWRDPSTGINRGPQGFGHPRGGGCHFALADASVRFVSDKIGPATLKALATPAGGEKIDDPEW